MSSASNSAELTSESSQRFQSSKSEMLRLKYKKISSEGRTSLNILMVGDIHVEISTIQEHRIALRKLREYLEVCGSTVDIIVSAGDILHEHGKLHATCLNVAIEYAKLFIEFAPTYFIVGNHDMVNQSAFLSSQHWMECLKEWPLIIVDNVLIENIKGYKIVFCPYVPEGRFIEALNTRKGDWEDAKAILSHVTIRGANMGSLIAKDADTWDPSFPMLISGHIHLRQWLNKNMYYTGSLMQVACDETPEKSLAYISVGDSVSIKEINLDLPKKIILREDIENIDDFVIPLEPNIKYTLYISGEYESFNAFRKSSKYKELIKHPQLGKRIRFKPTSSQRKDRNNEITQLRKTKQKKFHELLIETIQKDDDQYLHSLYDHLLDSTNPDISDEMEEILIIKPNKILS